MCSVFFTASADQHRMDALSTALDAELYQLALEDENLVSETIEDGTDLLIHVESQLHHFNFDF